MRLCAVGMRNAILGNDLNLTQDKREFWFEFCNCAVSFSVYIVWLSVLSLKNLKIYKIKAVKNISIKENFIPLLPFNPGLALTGFRTNRP